ncbi:MAG: RagB/SusD family nutrient uptake outer membrane protein, partial [Bacteroidales bacterium]
MKKNIILSAIAVLSALVLSSCVQDLNVKPIDPNLSLPEDVLNSVSAYEQVLAKCYQGLSCSSSSGPDGSADIDGVDGGFGQYMRALFYN